MTGEDVLIARLEWHRDSANLKAPSHWVSGTAIWPCQRRHSSDEDAFNISIVHGYS
jgi:hypothetical protein